MIDLRPASANDHPQIRALIRRVGINPGGLQWPRFTVAEIKGEFSGCVQLKPHRDGSLELASLAVVAERQRLGIGRKLMEHCLAKVEGDLHLMCAGHMQAYYEGYGFVALQQEEMPRYFQRVARAARLVESISSGRLRLVVMKYVKCST